MDTYFGEVNVEDRIARMYRQMFEDLEKLSQKWLPDFQEETSKWIQDLLRDAFDPAGMMEFLRGMGMDMGQFSQMFGRMAQAGTMPQGFDPYQVLGLDKSATDEEVEQAQESTEEETTEEATTDEATEEEVEVMQYSIDSKMEDLLDPRLKGQICWPDPIQDTNIQLITLALARGGDQHNLEPGWQFLKELAKSGNIGRVAKTEVEFINSMTIGETSVAIWNQGPWHKVSQNAPVKFLTKIPGEKAFKALLYQECWVLLKSSKHKKAAKEYLNFFISPENNEAYNLAIGEAPANSKAKAGNSVEHLSFTKEQFDQYAMVPDYDYCAKHIDGWVKRFETEIIPLL